MSALTGASVVDRYFRGLRSRYQNIRASDVRHLQCAATLRGHQGCVNTLSWSQDGNCLVSGSDDMAVIVWRWSDAKCGMIPQHVIDSGHHANIFGVKFLNFTDNTQIVSCAMDNRVMFHQYSPGSGGAPVARPPFRRRRAQQSATTGAEFFSSDWKSTLSYKHRDRGMAVEVDPVGPFVYWSASEDGEICQFDTRVAQSEPVLQLSISSQHRIIPDFLCHYNVMGEFSTGGRGGTANRGYYCGVKTMCINAINPNLLAVGTVDPFLRVFDRRILPRKTQTSWPYHDNFAQAHENVLLYTPLTTVDDPAMARKTTPLRHITHTEFDASGNIIMANYHGDAVYLFDIRSSGMSAPVAVCGGGEGEEAGNDILLAPTLHDGFPRTLPQQTTAERNSPIEERAEKATPAAPNGVRASVAQAQERLKDAGNKKFKEKRWTSAINFFSAGIALGCEESDPTALALLLNNRATTYMKRKHPGDVQAAVRDASDSLKLDPSRWKASLRLCAALTQAGYYKTAESACNRFLEQAEHLFCAEDDAGLRDTAVREVTKLRETAVAKHADLESRSSGGPLASEMEDVAESTDGVIDADADGESDGDIDGDADERGDSDENADGDESDADEDADAGEDGSTGSEEDEGDDVSESAEELSEGEARGPLPVVDVGDLSNLRHPKVVHHEALRWPAFPCGSLKSCLDYVPAGLEENSFACASVLTCLSSHHYIGHANVQTDIKEAAFWNRPLAGISDSILDMISEIDPDIALDVLDSRLQDLKGTGFVLAGSDSGHVMVYQRTTGALLAAIPADKDICNCLRPHPTMPLLATSGIEDDIRLWSPFADGAAGRKPERDPEVLVALTEQNNQEASSNLSTGVPAAFVRAMMRQAGTERAICPVQ